MSLFSRKQNEESKEEQVTQEEKVAETLGAKIARLRKEKGYTQEEFSQLLDVTAQAVSKWENDISCPDIMLLPKISQLLGVSIDEMLGNSAPKAETAEETKPKVDINKLNLRIRVTGEGKKPVNVAFPMAMVKKFTKLGTGISNIVNVNSPSIDSKKIEQIFDLVDEGVTGEVLNITDENGQNIIIEIS
ncbi:MAG: helix-turn-helix domain-containing protein [Clostridia bacterium]|nr:helix-turn-helix domain-containing protein [Clostridia bacterium]